MIFHHRQRNISKYRPLLKINGQTIDRVSEFNFLGLIIDEHLTWDAHIQKTSNKISRALGIMSRLKRFLPRNVLRLIYNSLILPHLQYGILIWGFKNSRLGKLQKRAVRIMFNTKYNAHTGPLFKQLNLLKLSDIFKTRQIRFYFRYINNSLPVYFKDIFATISQFHTHKTRIINEIRIARTNTAHADKSIRIFLPDVISKLPACITDMIETRSYDGFSRYVDRFIIDTYESSCSRTNCYICRS